MQSPYPLTREQERLWIEWKLNPLGHSYNTNFQFELEGEVDVGRLQQAIHVATDLFGSFRTYFLEAKGIPQQVILSEAKIALESVDLTLTQDWSPESARQQAEIILTERLRAPFDLTMFPLTRFCLVKWAPKRYYFIYVTPHIIVDGHSARLLLKALSTVYNQGSDAIATLSQAKQKNLGDYLTYTDTKQDKVWKKAAGEYWQQALENTRLHLELNHGRQSQSMDRKGARAHFSLPATTYKELKALAKKQRTTLFGMLSSLFGVFLYRYFNQGNFVLTYPVDIRPLEFKQLFGFYINNLPLRMNLKDGLTFNDVVGLVTDQRRSDRHYEDFSLKDIVSALRKTGDVSAQAIFNIVLAEANFSLKGLDLKNIQSTPRPCNYGEVNGDLALLYDGSDETLELAWDYKTSLFDAALISEATESFKTLVESVLKSPLATIDSLSLLSVAQQNQILTFSVNNAPAASSHPTLHAFVEAQAAKTPEAIALIYEGQFLTYEALNERAEKLASYLQQTGIEHGSHVALLMERSFELIVSLLAVLKVGAVYVPLDPTHPQKRLEWVIHDCGAKILLTQESLSSWITPTIPVVCVDALPGPDGKRTPVAITADDPAYIIYTSGSTGTPKGVVVSHGNAACRVEWLKNTFPLKTNERALQNMNYCFDPSVYEIFFPLSLGATLVLTSQQTSKQPRKLIELIDNYHIAMACFVPSFWQVVASAMQEDEGKSLRYVTAGGEALSPQLVELFHTKLNAEVFNLYGPTEGTIIATYHHCRRGENLSVIPIGKPLDQTSIYILDKKQQLLPIGVVGEICIGGAGVALGYLHNPTLTKERFIPDPFSTKPGARLFRTQDLGRYLPDGTIEFLGRADHQVKIRGYRIELGEVETALRDCGLVEDAVVAMHQIDAHTKQLVAYYIPKESVSEHPLREVLAANLPDYMVPAYFVALTQFPFTSNGKVDRAALPTPLTQTLKKLARIAPQNPTEQRMLEIWAKLLRRDPASISIQEKFFDAGGDSLMAMELCFLVEDAFGIKVPDIAVYSLPTIEDWARYITAKEAPADNVTTIQDRAQKRRQAMGVRQRQREEAYG